MSAMDFEAAMPTPRPLPPSEIQPMPTTVGIPEGHGSAEGRAKPRPRYPSPMDPKTRGVIGLPETRNHSLLALLKHLLKHR